MLDCNAAVLFDSYHGVDVRIKFEGATVPYANLG